MTQTVPIRPDLQVPRSRHCRYAGHVTTEAVLDRPMLAGEDLREPGGTCGPEFEQANALFHQGRFEEALAGYRRVRSHHPGSVAALINGSAALAKLERLDEALADLDIALQKEPHDRAALYNRGRVNALRRSFSDALRDLDLLLALEPHDAAGLEARGGVLLEMEEPEQALDAFDQSIQADPNWAPVHYNRAKALNKLARTQEALQSVERALELEPGLEVARDLRRRLMRSRMEELAREGSVRWSGKKPQLPHHRVNPSPGPPPSEWIVSNRR